MLVRIWVEACREGGLGVKEVRKLWEEKILAREGLSGDGEASLWGSWAWLRGSHADLSHLRQPPSSEGLGLWSLGTTCDVPSCLL